MGLEKYVQVIERAASHYTTSPCNLWNHLLINLWLDFDRVLLEIAKLGVYPYIRRNIYNLCILDVSKPAGKPGCIIPTLIA